MEITKGKIREAVRAVFYGPEGIGKSTLAASAPNPVFLDIESGTHHLDTARAIPREFAEVEKFLRTFAGEFGTIVIDTADWLEKLAVDHVCRANGKKSIEDFGYGKGYTHLAEAMKKVLDQLTAIRDKYQTHIILLAHSAMRKVELPEESGAFDRWELKCSKTVSPLLKEWADMVLFLNYEVIVVSEVNGRNKAQGGRRAMYSQHHACWDAKNRHNLPDKMPLEWAAIAGAFGTIAPPTNPPPPPSSVVNAIEDDFSPQPPPKEFDGMAQAVKDNLEDAGLTAADLLGYLASRGVVPAGTAFANLNRPTLEKVLAGWKTTKTNIQSWRQTNG